MRKSKYDQSSLPVQNSKDIDKDNNISKIENRVDFDTELVNLVNQIEDIKACADSSKVDTELSTNAFICLNSWIMALMSSI